MSTVFEAFKDRDRRPVAFFLTVAAACAVSILFSSLWQVMLPALAR